MAKIAVVLGGILCFVTGIAGYLSFRGATEGDILDNFSGWIASIFKIGVVGHLILYIPNEVRNSRTNVEGGMYPVCGVQATA